VTQTLEQTVIELWDASIVPTLTRYIEIPNKSPMFDAQWQSHGHMHTAVRLLADWCAASGVRNLTHEIVELPERTPLLFCEVAASAPGAPDVLLYGHYDKQPEFTGWHAGLGPWTPVLSNGRLFGRGGADDGYALFASLAAIRALQQAGVPHGRCVLLIEGCEESGSYDLPAYLDALAPRIGTPALVICLDAECGDYDHLWLSTSLRGLLIGNLEVGVLTEGVHSGAASGIVPSSFRILRRLLDRLEDPDSGALIDALQVPIDRRLRADAAAVAESLGDLVTGRYPWLPGMSAMSDDPVELILNNTWRPTLSVTGLSGAPGVDAAGNTLRPTTTAKLSIRLPPSLDAATAERTVQELLQANPPYGAQVRFVSDGAQPGWAAPPLDARLANSFAAASMRYFERPVRYMGMGGTIPFLKMLGDRFGAAQFMVTGVLGPHSNAHGPNEFLDIATGKRVTCCVAHVLAEYARPADADA
jgi:acetylornithine deacetylase/succinyl-diaminopimelate desuccinylase-like protein